MTINLISESILEEAIKEEEIRAQAVQKSELLSSAVALTTFSASKVADMLKGMEGGKGTSVTSEENSSTGSSSTTSTSSTTSANGISAPEGEEAVFAAAGNMTMLQNNVYSSLQQTLENQIQMINALITATQQELQELSEAEEQMNAAQKQVQEDKDKGYNQKYIEVYVPPYYCVSQLNPNYKTYQQDEQTYKDAQANYNSILKSPLFEGDPATATQLINRLSNVAKGLMKSLQTLSMLVAVVQQTSGQSSGQGIDLLFAMEGEVLSLQNVAMQDNTNNSLNHQSIGSVESAIMTSNLNEIIDQIKKLEKLNSSKKHHGIFSFIWDAVKSVEKKLQNACAALADTVASAAVSELSKAAKSFGANKSADKLSKTSDSLHKDASKAFNEVIGGFKILIQACKDLVHGKNIVKDLAMILVSCTWIGLIYDLMLNTSFGEDLTEMGELAIDVGQELGLLAYAAGTTIVDKDAAKSILDNQCANVGIDMVSNPALQVVSDMGMMTIIAASAATGQLWMAAIMTALLVANDFGGQDCLANLVVKIVEGCGAHLSDKQKDIIKVAVDAAVIIAMTVGGAWAGGIEDAADVAVEDAENAGREAAEDAEKSIKTQVKEFVAKILNSQVSMALMTFSAMFGSSNIMNDAADLDKNNDKLKKILEIIQYSLTALTAALSCVGMGLAGAVADDGENIGDRVDQFLRRKITRYAEFFERNITAMMAMTAKINAISMAIQSGVDFIEAGGQIIQGEVQATLSEYQGLQTMMNAAESMNQKMEDQLVSYRKVLAKEYDQIVNNLNAPGLMSEGIAAALLQNV